MHFQVQLNRFRPVAQVGTLVALSQLTVGPLSLYPSAGLEHVSFLDGGESYGRGHEAPRCQSQESCWHSWIVDDAR